MTQSELEQRALSSIEALLAWYTSGECLEVPQRGSLLRDGLEDSAFALRSRLNHTLGVADTPAPLRHATKDNGDCPHWCAACAAERAARGVKVGGDGHA